MNIQITSGPLPGPGHNGAPEPTPFELSRDEIEGLYLEAKNWADGSAVETQEQADAIGKLIALIRAAESTAEDRRKTENIPFDTGKAEVQARYADLIADTKAKKGMTVLAKDALTKALTPFLVAKGLAQRKIAEAARVEAQRQQEAAQAAIRAAAGTTDLEAQEAAEVLLTSAKKAESVASKAEAARPQAKGVGRAISLRTVYTPEITNRTEFARYVWTNHPDDIAAFLTELAPKLVARGLHTMPGIVIHETKVPV